MAKVRKVKPGRREKPIDEELLVAKYMEGATMQELAKEFGVAQSTISRRLAKIGVKTRRAYWM